MIELTTYRCLAENPEAESRLRNLRILVNGLPEANKATVFYLLRFLSKVVANEKVNRHVHYVTLSYPSLSGRSRSLICCDVAVMNTNRMSAANLAMIFSPNLLRTEKEELSQIMMEAGYLTSVVKLMIEEIDYMTNVRPQRHISVINM